MHFKNYFKKIYLSICAIFMSITFFSMTNSCQNTTIALAEPEQNDVYEKIDTYLNNATKYAHFPAMSITIVNQNDVVFENTYGNCKNTDTPFLLGSVSKSFTALSVMQLVEQGKIALDAPLSTYLHNATNGDKITILQLLNHTSGLDVYQNLTNYRITGKQGIHEYANVNYALLGEVIESVSGVKYEDYVTNNIFTPLAMSNSSTSYKESKKNGLIESYENWFGFNIKTTPKYPKSDNAWITTSAGYLSSSTADLGKYLQMYLCGGKGIISEDSINKMFYENVPVEASIPYKYGMGWTLINDPLKQPALRHSGLVETGMSAIYILPEMKIGVAIVINTNDYFVGKDLMDRIDWSVALMLMGDGPNEIKQNEYVLRHLLYDFIYIIILSAAILPLFLIKFYKKHLLKGKWSLNISMLVLLHLVLPIFLLLLPQMLFATPLWVVKAFVPDLFTCLIISASSLIIGGIIKSILLIKSTKKI